MPEFGFNGIGDFTSGFGYQIKLTEAIDGFSLCDWYINDIPEDNIVSLQEEIENLQAELYSIYGCMDSLACNYYPEANVTDGSCWYTEQCYVLITDDNIQHAVDAWIADSVSAEATYGHISNWDVSSVTDMSLLFFQAESFNGDISGWDVSSVTNMSSLFSQAESFNGDISGWDVSSVTNMRQIFFGASSFNGDISGWDVSSVTNMVMMFAGASSFNQDISGWDVSNVTSISDIFFYSLNDLSDENKCAIETTFSLNGNISWTYDWCP
ncbi:MAG: hypothetical protein CMD07_02085 [Flavobacteriales bacterium]|nr:hypothetical protein [Flavobacteriales bacterium]